MQAPLRFLDSFGFHWQVVEIDGPATDTAPTTDTARPRGWLYFISRGWTRVIREYPAEWGRLDWAQLEDLCAQAVPLGESVVHPAWRHRGEVPGSYALAGSGAAGKRRTTTRSETSR